MRNLKTMICSLGAAAMLMGCSTMQSMHSPYRSEMNTRPEPENQTPLLVDSAMQLRDWEPSTAHYGNGDTIAGNTGFKLEPKPSQEPYYYPIIEPALFLGQTIALPVTIWTPLPWKPVRYTGETFEPTYTAMPVLPPAMQQPEPQVAVGEPIITTMPTTEPATEPSTEPTGMPQ